MAGLRGFASAAEHDRVILGNWNAAVRPGDLAFILGDFAMSWKEARETLAAMNGRKILIAGNHDIVSGVHRNSWKHCAELTGDGAFTAIQAFARRRVAGREFLLSHFPYQGHGDHVPGEERYTQFRLPDLGMWLVHGHLHCADKVTGPRQVYAGLDAWGLMPASEEEILALMSGDDDEDPRGRQDH